jgi:hypothetical protein
MRKSCWVYLARVPSVFIINGEISENISKAVNHSALRWTNRPTPCYLNYTTRKSGPLCALSFDYKQKVSFTKLGEN